MPMRDKTETGTIEPITTRLLLGYARVSTDDQDLTNQGSFQKTENKAR